MGDRLHIALRAQLNILCGVRQVVVRKELDRLRRDPATPPGADSASAGSLQAATVPTPPAVVRMALLSDVDADGFSAALCMVPSTVWMCFKPVATGNSVAIGSPGNLAWWSCALLASAFTRSSACASAASGSVASGLPSAEISRPCAARSAP